MSFAGIDEIKNADTPGEVNEALRKGWELLAVNSMGDGMLYTLGRRAKKEAPKLPSAADIARANGLDV